MSQIPSSPILIECWILATERGHVHEVGKEIELMADTKKSVHKNKQHFLIQLPTQGAESELPSKYWAGCAIIGSCYDEEFKKSEQVFFHEDVFQTITWCEGKIRERQKTCPDYCPTIVIIANQALANQVITHRNCQMVQVIKSLIDLPYSAGSGINPMWPIPPSPWKLSIIGKVRHPENSIKQSWNDFQVLTFQKGENHEMGEEKKYVNHEEQQYKQLVLQVIKEGKLKVDKIVEKKDDKGKMVTLPMNMSTRALFGSPKMVYNLRETIPILQHKTIYTTNITKELAMFISGKTNTKVLKNNKDIGIWDDDTSETVLKKRGLPWAEGDMGPGYPFQWRHWGAEYKGCIDAQGKEISYEGQGVDQLKNLIDGLKADVAGRRSRRHVLSAWNVCDIPRMTLPPCHLLVIFDVTEGRLSSLMLQRSGDLGLGVPYNIIFYALFTYLVAHEIGTDVANFIHYIADYHVYMNHIDILKPLMSLPDKPFPPRPTLKPSFTSIYQFKYDDFIFAQMNPHPFVKLPMNVSL